MLYGKPRYLGMLSLEEPVELPKGGDVLVRTSRGEERAVCCGLLSPDALGRLGQTFFGCPPEEAEESGGRGGAFLKPLSASGSRSFHGKEEPRGAHRNGGENDVEEVVYLGPLEEEHRQSLAALRLEETDALREARVMLREHKLDMKLVDVEYPLDRKKIFLYFTSEQRVDFRGYVKDLAKIFKTRIELRQIGIRDEAKVVGGIAPCGLPCCCSHWLHRFAPICIRMVKEQNLALNPVKISGLCGRLMCCMGYEYTTYHELWERLPNPGSKIRGPRGVYAVSGVDLATQSVRLYGEGKEISVAVNDFPAFKKSLAEGTVWEPEASSPTTSDRRQDGKSRLEQDSATSLSPRRSGTEGKRSLDNLGKDHPSRQGEAPGGPRKKDGKGGSPASALTDGTSGEPNGDHPLRGDRGGKKGRPSGGDGEKSLSRARPQDQKPSLLNQGDPLLALLPPENARDEATWRGAEDPDLPLAPEKKRRRKRRRPSPKPDLPGERPEGPSVRPEKNLSEEAQKGEGSRPRKAESIQGGLRDETADPRKLDESPEEGKTTSKRRRHRPRHKKPSPNSLEKSPPPPSEGP